MFPYLSKLFFPFLSSLESVPISYIGGPCLLSIFSAWPNPCSFFSSRPTPCPSPCHMVEYSDTMVPPPLPSSYPITHASQVSTILGIKPFTLSILTHTHSHTILSPCLHLYHHTYTHPIRRAYTHLLRADYARGGRFGYLTAHIKIRSWCLVWI